MLSRPALDVADFVSKAEALSLDPLFSRSATDRFSTHPSFSVPSIVQVMFTND